MLVNSNRHCLVQRFLRAYSATWNENSVFCQWLLLLGTISIYSKTQYKINFRFWLQYRIGVTASYEKGFAVQSRGKKTLWSLFAVTCSSHLYPVLQKFPYAPWRPMKYISTYSQPRYYKDVSSKLQAKAVLLGRKAHIFSSTALLVKLNTESRYKDGLTWDATVVPPSPALAVYQSNQGHGH